MASRPSAGRFYSGPTLQQLYYWEPRFILYTNDPPAQAATEYNVVDHQPFLDGAAAIQDAHWSLTEANHYGVLLHDSIIDHMHILLNVAPGGAASWTFTLRDDAASTTCTVTLTGAALWGVAYPNVLVAAHSVVDTMCVPAGNPTVAGLNQIAIGYWYHEV